MWGENLHFVKNKQKQDAKAAFSQFPIPIAKRRTNTYHSMSGKVNVWEYRPLDFFDEESLSSLLLTHILSLITRKATTKNNVLTLVLSNQQNMGQVHLENEVGITGGSCLYSSWEDKGINVVTRDHSVSLSQTGKHWLHSKTLCKSSKRSKR